MESILNKETYVGYDKDNKAIYTSPAEDANNYANPEEVKKAIDALIKAAQEGCDSIKKAANAIMGDIETAINVNGKTMVNSVVQICETVDKIPSGIEAKVQALYELSIAVHNKLQKKYNDEAKAQASGHDGVVRVELQ